jgi:chemotaxis protein methyltransferase CheR
MALAASRTRLFRALRLWTGLDLERSGAAAALRFVDARARALGQSPDAYIDSLDGPRHAEVLQLLQAITVGHTWFYRNPEQLEALSRAARQAAGRSGAVHVWVPACASGEDVFTLAMLARRDGWEGTFLGTDINANYLERAEDGRYGEWSVRALPEPLRSNLARTPAGLFQIPPTIRSVCRFAFHNLMDFPLPSPDKVGFRFILCRNVLIYFRARDARRALERLSRALAPGGTLFTGATDVLSTVPAGLRQVVVEGQTAFRPSTRPSRPPLAKGFDESGSERGANVPAPARTRRSSGQHRRAGPELGSLIAGGIDAMNAERHPVALTAFAQALEMDPLHAVTHMLLGMTHYLAGDLSASLRSLRAALLLDPHLWIATFYLARVHEKMGHESDAERAFARVRAALQRPEALSADPRWPIELEVWKRDIAEFVWNRSR